ncbi:ras-associated and pleckstrin homology domains-containing protein 1-like isoform X2 [Gigantopelta aegis]|nr:ras-associated and pleckstrin homology domains-containing protein 1-like isoform X2 [Gigantopelta aegis]
MAMESFRFSFLNSDENQDVNFDAILGELCELETQLSTTQSELSRTLGGYPVSLTSDHDKRNGGGDGTNDMIQAELDALAAEITQGLGYWKNGGGAEDTACDIGETDSAFSDNTSLPSSESFTSMVTVSSSADTTSSSSGDTCSTGSVMSAMTVQSEEEQRARLKAEKIRIALEKIKQAKIRKLFVRAFAKDGSSKSILVDEKMTVGHVTSLLTDKNHMRLNTKLTVIEHMPDLFMERILEDHDTLVENMVMWTRDSKNKILFEERQEKYEIFQHPEKYLLMGTSSEKGISLSPKQQDNLIQEFFTRPGSHVPDVEGALYLKSDGKKAWKKYFFVLRASGLYYNPRGKTSKAPKDLVCLVQFEFVEVYYGLGWKKKYHAPTDYCFALKHPQIQKKNSKYIRYFSAESKTALDQWVMGIRLAKIGKQVLHNYDKLQHDVSTWDLRDNTEQVNNFRASNYINDNIALNNTGNLHSSQMSVPEPNSRHSIVTVVNASLIRNSTSGGPDCENPNEIIGIEVTPIPDRKSSITGISCGDSSQPKTPVKRVSFSNTHSIINADTGEELLHPKHRDSITSASTDSSEDSNSSGEGRHSLSARGKLRPKLPVTTETTRQLSEMFQTSTDNVSYGDSVFVEDRKPSLSYSEKRRSSSSSISSDKDRRAAEVGSKKISHVRSSSGPSQAPLSQRSEVCSQGDVQIQHNVSQSMSPQSVRQHTPPPARQHTPPPPPAAANMSHTITQPARSGPSPPVLPPAPTCPAPSPVCSPQAPAKKCQPPPPPTPATASKCSQPQVKNVVPSSAACSQAANNTQNSLSSARGPPQNDMPRVQQNGCASPGMNGRMTPQPPDGHGHYQQLGGRGPPPPPPQKGQPPPQKGQPPPPPQKSNHPPAPPMTQRHPGSMNGMPPSPQISRAPGMDACMNGSVGHMRKSSRSEGDGSSPTRSAIPVPMPTAPQEQHPPMTAPKPKQPPMSPAVSQHNKTQGHHPPMQASNSLPNGNHVGKLPQGNHPASPSFADHGVPMPPPMPLLQTSPTQSISQRLSNIKHPSPPTATPLITASSNKHGPKNIQRTNSSPKGNVDNESGVSLPFLAELSKRSSNIHHGAAPNQVHVGHSHSGQGMTRGNHTAECVSVPHQTNKANHRRSSSTGGGGGSGIGNKPQGHPVGPKSDSKRPPPPPPPKRSEHTRLSSDQTRQIQLDQPVQDPIYENCEGIMDINELPPPPPEFLEGLAMKGEQQHQQHQQLQQQQQQQQASMKKGRPPPPPPKRSKDTQLSH